MKWNFYWFSYFYFVIHEDCSFLVFLYLILMLVFTLKVWNDFHIWYHSSHHKGAQYINNIFFLKKTLHYNCCEASKKCNVSRLKKIEFHCTIKRRVLLQHTPKTFTTYLAMKMSAKVHHSLVLSTSYCYSSQGVTKACSVIPCVIGS